MGPGTVVMNSELREPGFELLEAVGVCRLTPRGQGSQGGESPLPIETSRGLWQRWPGEWPDTQLPQVRRGKAHCPPRNQVTD